VFKKSSFERSLICFFMFVLIGLLSYCSQCREKITYKELRLKNEKIDFEITDNVFTAFNIIKSDENIYFQSADYIWAIDSNTGKVKSFIKSGVGPNEIYGPHIMKSFGNEIYVNSYFALEYISHFTADASEAIVNRLNLNEPVNFDDFEFLTKDRIVMANVYWEDGLVRIYDLKNRQLDKIGKSKIIPLMHAFNVNSASLCIMDGNIYVSQRILPEIQVISCKNEKVIDTIKLSPPFFVPMPPKYKVEKYDDKGHRAWMASWTSIISIMGKNGWLLIKYKRGYDELFYYELLNAQRTDNRYFLNETSDEIYNFEVKGNEIIFEMTDELEDRLVWKSVQADIY